MEDVASASIWGRAPSRVAAVTTIAGTSITSDAGAGPGVGIGAGAGPGIGIGMLASEVSPYGSSPAG